MSNLPDGVLPLQDKSEFRLAKTILKFTDCILNILDNFLLHQVSFFATERNGTSLIYHLFYVIEKPSLRFVRDLFLSLEFSSFVIMSILWQQYSTTFTMNVT